MKFAEIQQKISPILKKHGIKHAALFGSVAREEEKLESDVDILISLGTPMGLIAYNQLNREIEESLDRKVDLVTEQSLNKFVKPYILADLKTIYEG